MTPTPAPMESRAFEECCCSGCGQNAMVRVHLIGDIKICPACIDLMMNIVENEAPESAVWKVRSKQRIVDMLGAQGIVEGIARAMMVAIDIPSDNPGSGSLDWTGNDVWSCDFHTMSSTCLSAIIGKLKGDTCD